MYMLFSWRGIATTNGLEIFRMPDEERQQPQHDADIYGDEKVPTVVLIIVCALAVLTVVLYMTVAGGHNHFH